MPVSLQMVPGIQAKNMAFLSGQSMAGGRRHVSQGCQKLLAQSGLRLSARPPVSEEMQGRRAATSMLGGIFLCVTGQASTPFGIFHL